MILERESTLSVLSLMNFRAVLYLALCFTQLSAAIAAVITNRRRLWSLAPSAAAIESATPGEILTFDPALSGQTIILTSGELRIETDLTVNGSSLPGGIILNAQMSSGIISISGVDTVATLDTLTITHGDTGIVNGGTLTVNNSTISDNVGRHGGGISNFGALILNSCTIANNSTPDDGGGLNTGLSFGSEATAFLNSCTVFNNSAGDVGGGIGGRGNVTIRNSIIAGNAAREFPEIQGLTDLGDSSNLIGGDPYLAPLGRYGGPTPTAPPFPGSPAIDSGDVVEATTDQRGGARTINGTSDIGAVEFGALPGSVPLPLSSAVVTNDSDITEASSTKDFADLSLREAIAFATPGAVVTFARDLSGATVHTRRGTTTATPRYYGRRISSGIGLLSRRPIGLSYRIGRMKERL